MKIALIVIGMALSSIGCAARYTVLTVPAVSMADSSFEPGTSAASARPVEATYCQGDAPLVSHDHNIGLIDEAVMKAQKQSGARYLRDVTISREGKCMVVEATAMK